MEKVAAALPSRMRAFRDRLPDVLNVKATPLKKRDDARFRRHISPQRGARPSAGQDALLLTIEPADAERLQRLGAAQLDSQLLVRLLIDIPSRALLAPERVLAVLAARTASRWRDLTEVIDGDGSRYFWMTKSKDVAP